jgi:hypothetical protein
VHRVRAADRAHTCLGQAEVADLACVDEFLDGAGDLLDRHLRVDAVLVEQVDGVGAEPPEGAVDGAADVLGIAGQSGLAALLVEREAELGGDDDLVAHGREGFADEFLVAIGAVDLGGVEEGDSAIDRGAQQVDHLATVARVRAEALAHAHAAEPEGGHLQAAGAQDALVHGRVSSIGRVGGIMRRRRRREGVPLVTGTGRTPLPPSDRPGGVLLVPLTTGPA